MLSNNSPYTLHAGKLEVVLPELYPDNYFDSIVMDGPYMIKFMGSAWDSVRNFQKWMEDKSRHLIRVLKPGGYLVNFCAPRTYHRMVSGLEDAGFEIRDQIFWVFASGFPKSHNLDGEFEGWGTALKPAHEPIVIARKPLNGTVLRNMQEFGVGALHIDACRVEGAGLWTFGNQPKLNGGRYQPGQLTPKERHAENITGGENGRWPANLIHDGSEEVLQYFPITKSGEGNVIKESAKGYQANAYGKEIREPGTPQISYGDKGSAARFFYCAKTSPEDRNEGLPEGTKNTHPTVKPTSLMRYLVKLVTPKGGIVLDPFMGSGSTGKGSMYEYMRFVGIDQDAHNIPIADARITFALKNRSNQIAIFE